MTATLQAQGNVAALTNGNLAITLPAYVADDIVVITTVGYVPNTATGANTQSLASPWNKFSPDVTTITGGLIDNEHAFWWARATSAASLGTTVTITRPTGWDTGNDTCWAGRAYVIRGAKQTGDPFDELISSAPSVTTVNPAIPAVTVSGEARLIVAFYVASDNLTAPVPGVGGPVSWFAQTAATTATGTDAGFQSYTASPLSAGSYGVTLDSGATSAQNFQVHFVASFAPRIVDATGYSRSGGFTSIFDNDITGDAGLTTNNPHYGIGFKPETSGTLDMVRVVLSTIGSPTGTVVAQIWSAGAGAFGTTQIPSTLLATSSTEAVSGLSTARTYINLAFTGANRIELTADTPYYLLVYHATAQASTNLVIVAFTRSTLYATAPGGGVFSTNNGTTFVADSPKTNIIYYVRLAGAVGARVGPTTERTATGSGTGTETAVGVKVVARQIFAHNGVSGIIVGDADSNRTANAQWTLDPATSTEFGTIFTATATGPVSEVVDHFTKSVGATGTLKMELWTNNESTFEPLALLATSNTINVADLPSTGTHYQGTLQPQHFSFNAPFTSLTSGTRYVLVYKYTSLVGTLTEWGQPENNAELVLTCKRKQVSDGQWVTLGGQDPKFSVLGPEAVGLVSRTRTATGSGTGTDSTTGQNAEIGINWSVWGSRVLL